MSRIAIIGNAGAGKSTIARKLAKARGLPDIEIDRLLWREGWALTPTDVYDRQHALIIATDRWVIDGLGHEASIPARLARATEIILIDMPLWMHFWLAAQRQIDWATGKLDHHPGGIAAMPQTEALFQSIWDVDQTWMPAIRTLCAGAEERGTRLTRLASVAEMDRFLAAI